MARQLERRISKLESAQTVSPSVGPPMLIICQPGEPKEDAIMRVCGPQGLPQRPPEDGPHLIVIPVASPARGKKGVAAIDDEV